MTAFSSFVAESCWSWSVRSRPACVCDPVQGRSRPPGGRGNRGDPLVPAAAARNPAGAAREHAWALPQTGGDEVTLPAAVRRSCPRGRCRCTSTRSRPCRPPPERAARQRQAGGAGRSRVEQGDAVRGGAMEDGAVWGGAVRCGAG
eukprot:scaffold103102_cov63-Phaeocystis_antarctica.AAC.6